jgi:glycosidase
MDAVKHMVHLAAQYHSLRIRDLFEQFGPRFWLVGETFTGGDGHQMIKDYLGPYELDGQFDFPLFWYILDTFARSSGFTSLDAAVKNTDTKYGTDAIMSPFLGNHDVARFISVANGDIWSDTKAQAWSDSRPLAPTSDEPYNRLKLAFVFLLTQTGVPLIYYGDEIGMPGTGDPDNRRKMKFSSLSAREEGVLQMVKKVGQIRQTYAAIRRGSRQTLYVDNDVYAYARSTGSGSSVIIVLNRSTGPKTVTISVPSNLGLNGVTLTDAISSSGSYTVQNNSLTVSNLGSWSGVILVP